MPQSLHQFIFYIFIMIPITAMSAEDIQDISGTWELNTQLSDDFQEKIKEQVGSARKKNRSKPDGFSGASGKGNGRSSGGSASGSGGGRPSESRGQRPSGSQLYGRSGRGYSRKTIQSELASLSLFAEKMQISTNNSEIIMTFSETEQRFIYTDGRGISVTSNGLTSNPMGPYIAEWETDNQLVIETTTSMGIKIEEYFVLSEDGNQLNTKISIRLPIFDDPIIINRIYDLIPEQ